MSISAQRFNIKDFPKTLKSLETNNPSDKQIQKDLKKLMSFNNHPVFQYVNRKNNFF
tara:strand:+ start:203 stop:373 length:171 start_codon:yes stop_codon:yes gene_type:complete